MTFFEKELHRLFDDSECISEDAVFVGKTMIAPIGEDLRDMFAGIVGFRSGLSKFGDFFMPIGFCEIDPYARRAYEAIYDTKGELFFEDARKIVPEDLPDINDRPYLRRDSIVWQCRTRSKLFNRWKARGL